MVLVLITPNTTGMFAALSETERELVARGSLAVVGKGIQMLLALVFSHNTY
jgi:hypothetical protein